MSSKKHWMDAFSCRHSRRNFIRGASAGLSIPMLECLTPLVQASTDPASLLKVIFMFNGNGTSIPFSVPDAGSGVLKFPEFRRDPAAIVREFKKNPFTGIDSYYADYAATMKANGTFSDFDLFGHALYALNDIVPDINYISGTHVNPMRSEGSHGYIGVSYFSGMNEKSNDSAAGPTVDHRIASHLKSIGKGTYLDVMYIGESSDFSDKKEGPLQTYSSYRAAGGSGNYIEAIRNPKYIIENYLGDIKEGAAPVPAAVSNVSRASIIDGVLGQYNSLKSRLTGADKTKIEQYLDTLRDLEKSLEQPGHVYSAQCSPLSGAVDESVDFLKYNETQIKLLALTMQCQITRVSQYLVTGLLSTRKDPGYVNAIGSKFKPGTAHSPSHFMDGDASMKILAQKHQAALHAKIFKMMVTTFKSFTDVDGNSLLHNSLILGGSDFGINTDDHSPMNGGLLVAGQGAGLVRTGRHFDFRANPIPHANVLQFILDCYGVKQKLELSTGSFNFT